MDVNVQFLGSEHTMLVPLRLPNPQDIAGFHQCRKIGRLVTRILNYK